MNILIVDDNIEILHILTHHLKKQNYIVYAAQSAAEAWEIINNYQINLAILDIMMPEIDGCELCRKIRQNYFFPILFLTAKSDENDKIDGLLCGADDYMLKPFSAAELLARVSSLIRRATVYNPTEKENSMQYKINQLTLDEAAGMVRVNEHNLDLTDIEYKLLLLLLRNKGKSLAIEFIFHEIWGEAFMQTSKNTVVVHVKNIRKKLSQYDSETEYIHTVWGKGYAIY